MKRLLLLLAASTCAVSFGCQRDQLSRVDPKQQRIDDLIEQAHEFNDLGLTDSAFAAFGLALEENPRVVEAHLGIGDIYKERGDYERASPRYEMAAALDLNNYDAHYNLGVCKQVLGDLPFAIRSYLRALAINPDSGEANRDLASAYMQDNKTGLALAYAERAAELSPESYGAWANLGFVYIRMGEFEKAVDALRAATELAADDTEATRVMLGLADAHIRLGNYTRSINVLQSVLRTEPTSTAHERMGVAMFKLRRYDDALSHFKQAIEFDDTDTAAHNGLGVAYMTLYIEGGRENVWQRDEAKRAWNRSLDLNPNQPAIVELVARYENI
ncbi:tetratricopeptide repeat protein [Phycisphaeraceae bacterium D3-23]